MADNKAVVQRMFDEVVNQGDLEVVDELFAPDFETTTPMGVMDREGFKHFVRGWRAGFSDLRCEIHDVASKNGTLLNGKKIPGPTRLQSGDQITLCGRRLTFHIAELAPEPAVAVG